MMHWNDGHLSNGWGIVMMLGMLTIWVLVAFVIVRFVRSTGTPKAEDPRPTAPATDGAEQILAERLARGEIEPQEYQARLTALR